MKCLDDCHVYEVAHFEDRDTVQTIKFIKKEPVDPVSSEMVTVQDGTTNEEVLRMLIHRMDGLIAKLPSQESYECKEHLVAAYNALLRRTEDRVDRGVEGTHQP